jgi:predicted  nucleic acid-binding Zn-ribbon protein
LNLENFEKELREIKEKDREAEENARKAAAPAVAPVPVLTEDMRKEVCSEFCPLLFDPT